MAGGVDEGDEVARGRRHLVGADVLRDAAGLVVGDVGLADRVEQRGLAVIDVAHDRDDRRTGIEILLQIRLVGGQALFDIRLGDAADRVAHLLGDELGRVRIDHVGDLVDLALLHEHADHVHRPLRHAVGELLDGDRLGDRHLAGQLLLLLDLPPAAHPLLAAAERGDGARALILAGGGVGDRQTAAVAIATRTLGGLGRGDDLERHAGTADDPLRLRLVLVDLGAAPGGRTRCGSTGRAGGGGGRGRLLGLRRGRRLGHEVQVAGLAVVRRQDLARLVGSRARGRRRRRAGGRGRRTRRGGNRTGAGRRRAGRGNGLTRRGAGSRSRCRSSRHRSSSGGRGSLCRRSGRHGGGLLHRSGGRSGGSRLCGGLSFGGGRLAGSLLGRLRLGGGAGGLLLGAAAGLGLLRLPAGFGLGGGAGRRSVLIGLAAGIGLAALGIGQGGGAGRAFLFAQRAQDHATGGGALRRARRRIAGTGGGAGGGGGSGRGRGVPGRRRGGGSDTALHRLDHDLLRTAMGEALAHHTLLDRALQRQRLTGSPLRRLVARVVRIAHPVRTLGVFNCLADCGPATPIPQSNSCRHRGARSIPPSEAESGSSVAAAAPSKERSRRHRDRQPAAPAPATSAACIT